MHNNTSIGEIAAMRLRMVELVARYAEKRTICRSRCI